MILIKPSFKFGFLVELALLLAWLAVQTKGASPANVLANLL